MVHVSKQYDGVGYTAQLPIVPLDHSAPPAFPKLLKLGNYYVSSINGYLCIVVDVIDVGVLPENDGCLEEGNALNSHPHIWYGLGVHSSTIS